MRGGLSDISYYFEPASPTEESPEKEINTRIQTVLADWRWAINESAVMADSTLDCNFVKAATAYYGTLEFQFVVSTSLNANTYVRVERYDLSGEYSTSVVEPEVTPNRNWDACVFYVNRSCFDKDSDNILTYNQQRTALSRAVGLALGLKINTTDNGVIMWQDVDTCTATVPTEEDLRNIRYLYE